MGIGRVESGLWSEDFLKICGNVSIDALISEEEDFTTSSCKDSEPVKEVKDGSEELLQTQSWMYYEFGFALSGLS